MAYQRAASHGPLKLRAFCTTDFCRIAQLEVLQAAARCARLHSFLAPLRSPTTMSALSKLTSWLRGSRKASEDAGDESGAQPSGLSFGDIAELYRHYKASSEHVLPAGQAWQPACEVSPVSLPNEPASHGFTTDAPIAQNPPTPQVLHAVPPSVS